MDNSHHEHENDLVSQRRRLNDLHVIAFAQYARATPREPDQESERRRASVTEIEDTEKQLQSLPADTLDARINAIKEKLEATERRDDAAADLAQRQNMEQLIRYEKAQAKARLQSVCADADSIQVVNSPIAPSSAKKSNLLVTSDPSLTMLGRILAHVPTTIPKLAKKLHISRTLLYVFRDSGGKPVKGKLGKDKVREIKTALQLEANRLGLAPLNKETQKELTN